MGVSTITIAAVKNGLTMKAAPWKKTWFGDIVVYQSPFPNPKTWDQCG